MLVGGLGAGRGAAGRRVGCLAAWRLGGGGGEELAGWWVELAGGLAGVGPEGYEGWRVGGLTSEMGQRVGGLAVMMPSNDGRHCIC